MGNILQYIAKWKGKPQNVCTIKMLFLFKESVCSVCVCVYECVHIRTLKTLKYYLLSLVGKIMNTSLMFSSIFCCSPSFFL